MRKICPHIEWANRTCRECSQIQHITCCECRKLNILMMVLCIEIDVILFSPLKIYVSRPNFSLLSTVHIHNSSIHPLHLYIYSLHAKTHTLNTRICASKLRMSVCELCVAAAFINFVVPQMSTYGCVYVCVSVLITFQKM